MNRMEGICEHGNYHCSTCEIKLLRLTVNELLADVKAKDAEIERLKEENQQLADQYNDTVYGLEASLAIAVESLEWYADLSYGGHRARQSLDCINSKED